MYKIKRLIATYFNTLNSKLDRFTGEVKEERILFLFLTLYKCASQGL